MKKFPLTILLIAANVVPFIVIAFTESKEGFGFHALTVLEWGGNFNPYTLNGQTWRLFTSLFLHFNIFHLLVNMQSLFYLGKVLERQTGKFNFVLVYLLCGIAGGLASLYGNIYVISAGASGAIFGLYGFVTIQAFISNFKKKKELYGLLGNFILFVIINYAISRAVNVDTPGHLGGFGFGVLAGSAEFFFKKGSFYIFQFRYKVFLFTSFILFTGIFFLLPKTQLKYFQMYQTMIGTEELANNMQYEEMPEDQLLNRFRELAVNWDSTMAIMEGLNDLPEALQSDLTILKQYVALRKADVVYRIAGTEKESYVYFDSTEYTSIKIQELPPIVYFLKMEEPEYFSDSVAKSPYKPAKVFYDSSWQETEEAGAVYFRTGSKDSLGRWCGDVRDYYFNGNIQMKGTYDQNLKDGVFLYYSPQQTYEAAGRYENNSKTGKWEYFHENGRLAREVYHGDNNLLIRAWDVKGEALIIDGEGEMAEYHENGELFYRGNYRDGLKEGTWTGFQEDGSPYFEEIYNNGFLIYGRSVTPEGNTYTYDQSGSYPNPVGGYEEFYKYVDANLVYPEEAKRNKISGIITMHFQVSPDGTVSDIVFVNKIGHGCEEEAMRLLKEGPEWLPAKMFGNEPFTSQGWVEINFGKKEEIQL